jgi:hypothetical protein
MLVVFECAQLKDSTLDIVVYPGVFSPSPATLD